MNITYTAFNPITELINKISVTDVQKIIERDDSFILMNDKGMLVFDDVAIMGEVTTLKIYKAYMQGTLRVSQKCQ